jgi:hypothetical protein
LVVKCPKRAHGLLQGECEYALDSFTCGTF